MIHAGIYYPHNSLKAKLCVTGKRMLYDYCKDRGIPFKNTGKLIVATNESQLKFDLRKIIHHAKRNGVDDLILLTSDDVGQSEPHIKCHGAIYSPSTGIVDSHEFMTHLLLDAEANGSILALQSPVEEARIANDYKNGKQLLMLQVGGMKLICDTVINCAGLHANHLASQIFTSWNGVDNHNDFPGNRPQFYAKGNYFKLQGQMAPFQHLVYPVPENGGLGIHSTIDLSGAVKFGPDIEWIDKSVLNPSDIDLTVDPCRSETFYSAIRKYWPDLQDGSLVPDYAGIRPKLGHISDDKNGETIYSDFLIQTKDDHRIDGFINLLGIESPGLTSSLAIAEYVAQLCTKQ